VSDPQLDQRALKRLVVAVAGCLAAVVVAGSVLGSRSVAADLRDRSRTALAAADLADVRVDFTGREARLSGGNDVEARLATSLVQALPGVRRVEVARGSRPHLRGVSRFELDRAGDDVEISGAVPSPDEAAAIKVSVATSLHTTVTGDVAVEPSVAAASWGDAMAKVLEIVAGVEGLALEIRGDGTVTLDGQVADAATRSRIVDEVGRALPGLELVATLRVATAPREGR
jgi:osmotically-inducible protein OsmY